MSALSWSGIIARDVDINLFILAVDFITQRKSEQAVVGTGYIANAGIEGVSGAAMLRGVNDR